jgi:hypothetical protein
LLRIHLGQKTIDVVYRLPENKDYAVVALFEAQDGTVRRYPSRGVVSRHDYGGRDIRLQMVWGKVDGQMQITQSWSGMQYPRNDGVWDDMQMTMMSGRDAEKDVWQGYDVVAYAHSRTDIEPRREIPDSTDHITRIIGRKRFVGILGVKAFPNEDEAKAEVYKRR